MNTTNQQDIISFLLKHQDYFINSLSELYPLSKRQLYKYKNILNWNKISENTNIAWSNELINTFSDSLNWSSLTINSAAFKDLTLLDVFQNKIDWKGDEDFDFDSIAANEGLPWDMSFIEKYESKIDFGKLSSNLKVKWSEELLLKYQGRWDMLDLAGNPSFPWNIHLFEKYLDLSYLFYFHTQINDSLIGNFDFVDKYKASLDWNYVSANQNLPWIERDLLNYWKPFINWWGIAHNHVLFQHDPDFFSKHQDKWESNGNYNFLALSGNEVLPWSIPFIEKYLDYWDWDSLTLNVGLPWSIELIDHFSQLLIWGGWITYPEPVQDGEFTFLGENNMGLVTNKSLPWSLELIQHFESNLEFNALASNHAVWDKAFKIYVDDKMIDKIMRIIN